MTTPGITRELASWAAGLTYEQLPTDVVDLARGLVLDYFRACAIGARTPWGAAGRELVAGLGGNGRSTVLIYGDQLDPARAALINGSFGHSADIDDTHVGSMFHPGAVVLSAALAMGEHLGSSGKDLITALVVGYEVGIRISLSVQPSHFQRGFQATGTVGTFAAAAAAARLMGADAETMAGALGTAGSAASALAQFYYSGSSVKRIHAGRAAEAGVMAALYSKAGVVGPSDILEGQAGFAHAYANAFDPSRITDGLGTDFKLSEITIKPHATSARVQAAVQAVQDLAREQAVDPSTVESIDVGIPRVIVGRLTQADPPDTSAAQMSLPFTVGLALVKAHQRGPGAPLAVEDYREELSNPEVRRLAKATDCRVDEAIDAATTDEVVPAQVTLRFRDGSQRVASVPKPRGAPGQPLSAEESATLFRAALQGLITTAQADAVIAGVQGLSDCVDISTITRELVGATAPVV